jgi:hypothetical protein
MDRLDRTVRASEQKVQSANAKLDRAEHALRYPGDERQYNSGLVLAKQGIHDLAHAVHSLPDEAKRIHTVEEIERDVDRMARGVNAQNLQGAQDIAQGLLGMLRDLRGRIQAGAGDMQRQEAALRGALDTAKRAVREEEVRVFDIIANHERQVVGKA